MESMYLVWLPAARRDDSTGLELGIGHGGGKGGEDGENGSEQKSHLNLQR